MSARTKPNDDWTEYHTPWVEEADDPFCYRVESRSGNGFGFHTVDLSQRGGHGSCTCTHFQIVANTNYRRHGRHIPYAPKREGVSECAHIRAALDHFHVHTTIPMLARFQHGMPANPKTTP